MDQYVTITNTIGEGFYTEKRSKFLAFAHHVETIDEAKAVVAHYKANIMMRGIVALLMCWVLSVTPIVLLMTVNRLLQRVVRFWDRSIALR